MKIASDPHLSLKNKFQYVKFFLKAVDNQYDIRSVMTTWTRQMGYPVITMRAQADFFHLTQNRFLLDNNNETEVNGSSDR